MEKDIKIRYIDSANTPVGQPNNSILNTTQVATLIAASVSKKAQLKKLAKDLPLGLKKLKVKVATLEPTFDKLMREMDSNVSAA